MVRDGQAGGQGLGRRGVGCLSKGLHTPADDGWVELAKYAREKGLSERTLRRRLTALHQRLGGGVLRSYNDPGTRIGKWWFNPVAVKVGLERDPDETETSLGEHLLRIEENEKKLNALRQSLNALRRQVNSMKASPNP